MSIELAPGWYALGFADEAGADGYLYDTVAEYHGNGAWTNEDGDPLTRVWCPALQHYVAPGSADRYVRQA